MPELQPGQVSSNEATFSPKHPGCCDLEPDFGPSDGAKGGGLLVPSGQRPHFESVSNKNKSLVEEASF